MNNKKVAIIVSVFIVSLFIIIGMIGIAQHIPFLGKPLVFMFAIILMVFVIAFFMILVKRRK